jgi:voltage-gated potassium channel
MHSDQLRIGTTSSRAASPGVSRAAHPGEGAVNRRFGIVLLLLVATYLFLACGFSGAWARALTTVMLAMTLLAALSASGTRLRLRRLARFVALACIALSIIAIPLGDGAVRDGIALESVLLVGAAPIAIATSILRRRVIDLRTVLGALCIYVLLGLLWAFVYTAIGTINAPSFFAQQPHPTTSQYVYFSFVTQTTVGYGDLTPAHSLGRALAALEALLGQIYLVTVVAVLVSNLLPARARNG